MGPLGQYVQNGPHGSAHWNAIHSAKVAIETYWENKNRRASNEKYEPKVTIHELLGDMEVHFW